MSLKNGRKEGGLSRASPRLLSSSKKIAPKTIDEKNKSSFQYRLHWEAGLLVRCHVPWESTPRSRHSISAWAGMLVEDLRAENANQRSIPARIVLTFQGWKSLHNRSAFTIHISSYHVVYFKYSNNFICQLYRHKTRGENVIY